MENMKITDLCPDILNSIEIEIKYAQVEKTQKYHKANITNFFRWVDSDEKRLFEKAYYWDFMRDIS